MSDNSLDQQQNLLTLLPARKVSLSPEDREIETSKLVALLKDVNAHLQETQGLHHYDWYTENEGMRVKEKIAKGNTYIIESESGEVIAAFSIGREKLLYPGDAQFDDREAYYLSLICVSPKYQGQGIGSKLLKSIESIIAIDVKTRGEDRYLIRFDARQEYEELIKFYKKRGYVEIGTVTEDEGEHYILFEKLTYIPDIPQPYKKYHLPQSKEA